MQKTPLDPLSLYLLCVRASIFHTWSNIWLVSSLFLAILSWSDLIHPFASLTWLSYDFLFGAVLPAMPITQKILAFLIWIVCGFIIAWLDAIRYGGVNAIRHLPRVLWLHGGAKRGLIPLLLLPITFYSLVNDHRIWSALHPYAPNIIFILFVGTPLILFRPPTALILTTSSNEAKLLLSVASTTLFPLRTITMLDTQRAALPAHMLGEDNLRTFDFVNWQKAVRVLMDAAPLIIVDGRTPSEVVANELCWITSSPSRLSKTIIITDDGGHINLWTDALPTANIFAVKRCPLRSFPASVWKTLDSHAAS